MNSRVYKLSILFLKYTPVIGAAIMMTHIALLITDKALLIADWTVSLPVIPAITAMVWSKTFGFCKIHRHFIAYVSAVSYCIKYQQHFGFGTLLTASRWVMFIIGFILFVWLSIRFKEFHYRCFKNADGNKTTSSKSHR